MTFPTPVAAVSRAWRRLRRALALIAGAALTLPVAAAQLAPSNLTRLIGESDVIVSGRVKSVTDGVDAQGVPFTEVTIAVAASAKRKLTPNKDFKFRQYGLLSSRKMADGRFLVAKAPEGFPTWHKEEQVVAFMNRPASKTGLRTTIGLSQGKFVSTGGRMANEQFNRGLFAGVEVSQGYLTPAESALLRSPAGAVDAATLMSLVNRAAAGKWIEKGVMR
ncbi:MAG TPA: hypothetical protein PL196_09555 [Burkholderiaceae bacterium]|nr:hypothetical protein [Burkholderiaceae bacterium]